MCKSGKLLKTDGIVGSGFSAALILTILIGNNYEVLSKSSGTLPIKSVRVGVVYVQVGI